MFLDVICASQSAAQNSVEAHPKLKRNISLKTNYNMLKKELVGFILWEMSEFNGIQQINITIHGASHVRCLKPKKSPKSFLTKTTFISLNKQKGLSSEASVEPHRAHFHDLDFHFFTYRV